MQLCPGAAVTEEQAGARLGASEGRPCKACLFWVQAIPEAEVQRTMAAGNLLGKMPIHVTLLQIFYVLYYNYFMFFIIIYMFFIIIILCYIIILK